MEAFRIEIMTVTAMILSEQFLTLGTVVTSVFHILNSYVSPQLPKLVTTACSFFSEVTKAAKD